MTLKHLLILSAFPFIIGCAFGTREVTLRNTEELLQKDSVTRNHTICFDSLSDKRPDSTVGHVQNGYGVHTADVISLNSVKEWVDNEIVVQLKNAGFTVDKNCGDLHNTIVLGGKITRVYTTAFMTYLGEVSINVIIYQNQKEILNKHYTGYEKGTSNFAATAESFRDILEISLKKAVAEVITDLERVDKVKYIESSPSTVTNYGNRNYTPSVSINSSPKKDIPDTSTVSCDSYSDRLMIIKGTRDLYSVQVKIDSVRSVLKHLYHDRFEINPTLSGSLCFYAKIGRDGIAEDITIINNSLNDKPIEEMLTTSVANCKFDDSEDASEIVCSFVFSEKSARSSKGAIAAIVAIIALIPLIISIVNFQSALSRY